MFNIFNGANDVLVFFLLTLNIFHPFSNISVVEFEQVAVSRDLFIESNMYYFSVPLLSTVNVNKVLIILMIMIIRCFIQRCNLPLNFCVLLYQLFFGKFLGKYYIIAQKITFSVLDYFGKSAQIRSFLRIFSHLLKKSLTENFVFYLQCILNR